MAQQMKTRTPLFSQQQPGGYRGYADIARHPYAVFFVQSTGTNAVDDARHGRSPDFPFATLDYAIAYCTASAGDVIYVMPGHVELVAAAGGLTIDVVGVTIIGCGNGTLQPIIRLTDSAADINIDAASCTFENIHFQAGAADIVAAIDVNCADLTIRKCRFSEQTAALNALIWIQEHLTDSSRITVEDCLIYAIDAANTHFINYAGVGDGHVFRRNVMIGDWGTIALGGAGVVTNCDISDNYIYNYSNTVDGTINFAATATGVMCNNRVCSLAAQANQITADAMAKNQNIAGVVAEDLNGIAEPPRA